MDVGSVERSLGRVEGKMDTLTVVTEKISSSVDSLNRAQSASQATANHLSTQVQQVSSTVEVTHKKLADALSRLNALKIWKEATEASGQELAATRKAWYERGWAFFLAAFGAIVSIALHFVKSK